MLCVCLLICLVSLDSLIDDDVLLKVILIHLENNRLFLINYLPYLPEQMVYWGDKT